MASTSGPGRHRAPGKHRRPGRACRAGARIAGVAGLATAGVVGSLAASAAAVPAAPAGGQGAAAPGAGLTRADVVADSLAGSVAEQARTQENAAAQAAAEAAARQAAERAEREQERAEAKRAARAAERAALQRYVTPVAASRVSTAYGVGGGMWSSGSHTGVDFHAAAGTSVRSVAAGEVVEAGWSGAYGYSVVVQHADGMYTQYGHLSSVTVAAGAHVPSGQQIGLSGSTGNSSGPHLHFEVRTGPDYGADVAPLAYLRRNGVEI